MTPQLRSGTIQAVFLGLAAASLVFGSPQLVGAASPLQQTAPSLGAASSFAVLGGQTVTNTGPSTVSADLGVSPGSAVTGFPPGLVVNGTIHAADALAAQAQDAITTVYNTLAGEACTLDLSGQDLGGMTLVPGVYCFTSSAQLTGMLTLNATGNGVFVFKIGSTLTTAPNSRVLLIPPSASQCNVFWQVGSSATLNTTSNFIGNIVALTSITLNTGASVSGRALARNGAVTLDSNTVGSPSCAVGLSTATPTATVPPAPAPFRPSQPAATVTPPTPTATLSAAAATATSAAATATATANTISGATATAISAATTATAITVAAGVAAAAPAAATATPPSAVTAPAPAVPNVPAPALTPVPTATTPPPQVPTALPRTGGGLPPVGLFSLLLGGLAVALAMTVRRTRK